TLYLQEVPAHDGFFTLDRAVQQGTEMTPDSMNDGFTLLFPLGPSVRAPYTIELAFHLDVGTESSGWGVTAIDGDALRLGNWFPIISTDHPYSDTLDPS